MKEILDDAFFQFHLQRKLAQRGALNPALSIADAAFATGHRRRRFAVALCPAMRAVEPLASILRSSVRRLSREPNIIAAQVGSDGLAQRFHFLRYCLRLLAMKSQKL
jgi:hypothetical protein